MLLSAVPEAVGTPAARGALPSPFPRSHSASQHPATAAPVLNGVCEHLRFISVLAVHPLARCALRSLLLSLMPFSLGKVSWKCSAFGQQGGPVPSGPAQILCLPAPSHFHHWVTSFLYLLSYSHSALYMLGLSHSLLCNCLNWTPSHTQANWGALKTRSTLLHFGWLSCVCTGERVWVI